MKCLFLFLVTTSYAYGYRTYIKPNIKLNWQKASEYCINTYGASLATISNEIESVHAEGACLATNYDPIGCWIGLYDISQTGQWTWISGAGVTFTDWGSGEPNNVNGNEYCTHIYSNYSTWNDIGCGVFLHFLCDATTNTPTISTNIPSNDPSSNPTNDPSNLPTQGPSHIPSISPIINPTKNPSILPTNNPSMLPSNIPSIPTTNPTILSKPPSNAPVINIVTSVPPIINNITILVTIVNNSNPHSINIQMFIIAFILVGSLILIVLCLMIIILKQKKQFKRNSNIIVNSYTSNTEMHNHKATDLRNGNDVNIQDVVSEYTDKEGILDLKSNNAILDILDDSDPLPIKGEPQIQSILSSNVSELYNISYDVNRNGNTSTNGTKSRNGDV